MLFSIIAVVGSLFASHIWHMKQLDQSIAEFEKFQDMAEEMSHEENEEYMQIWDKNFKCQMELVRYKNSLEDFAYEFNLNAQAQFKQCPFRMIFDEESNALKIMTPTRTTDAQ